MRKTSKPYIMEVSMVVWLDAHADSETWVELDSIDPEPMTITTVGIMLPRATKPGHVTLTQSYSDGMCDHVIHIPERMVQSITVLSTIPSAQE